MGQYLTGEPIIIADWILLASAYVLVSVRLWFRLLHQRRSLTISDLFLIVAAITVLAVMLIFQQEYSLGAMQKGKPQNVDIKKLSFATVLLYHSSVYCTKFSILAFYSNLFPSSSPRLRRVCFGIIIYTASCYLVAMFLAIFWCGSNVTRNWEIGPHACSVWSYTLFKVNFALNLSSDILIFVLPFPLLATLTLSKRQVVALCVTFGLGLITIAVSIGRCLALLQNAFIPLYVWSMAEMCTAIMVVSLPSLRPLLKKRSRSGANSSSPQSSGEKPISRALSKVRSSIAGTRSQHSSTHVRNLSNGGTASDLELINVAGKPKASFHAEELEASNQCQHQRRPQLDRPTSIDSRTPPQRSREWV